MGVLGGELYVIGGDMGNNKKDVEKFDGTSWQSVEPGPSQWFCDGNDAAIFMVLFCVTSFSRMVFRIITAYSLQ